MVQKHYWFYSTAALCCTLCVLYTVALSSVTTHTKCRQMPSAMYGATSAVSADDTKFTP